MHSANRPKSSPSTSARVNSGVASRRSDLKISDPVPYTLTHNRLSPEQEQAFVQQTDVSESNNTWPRKSMPAPYARNDNDSHGDIDTEHRMSMGPSLVFSSMSSGPSKTSLVQKKPGGLKATIRRMFGSKRERSSISGTNRDFYRSEPGDLVRTSRSRGTSRGHSQPERPVTKSSALGSHSPAEFAEHKTRQKNTESFAQLHKRRNTLPSLQFSELEIQDFSKLLDDHMGRSHPIRKSKEDDLIIYNEKRRSRSAEALTRPAVMQNLVENDRLDRSSEIAYWRNSAILNPLPTVVNPSAEPRRPQTSRGHNEKHRHQMEQSVKPIQSFDFGLSVGDGPIDLEERVNTIEVKMFDFEYAIARLQGVELPRPVLLPKVMKRKSVRKVFPLSPKASASTISSERGMTFLKSPEHSPPPSIDLDRSFATDRSSKATIRPSTSRRATNLFETTSSSTSIRLSNDEFETLLKLINEEKAARQQMEIKLQNLQKEIEILQTPVYATIRPLGNSIQNSRPSLDSKSKPKAKTLHRSPAFDFAKTPIHDVSRFSVSESEADSEAFQESYETPQEKSYHFETTRSSPLVSVSF